MEISIKLRYISKWKEFSPILISDQNYPIKTASRYAKVIEYIVKYIYKYKRIHIFLGYSLFDASTNHSGSFLQLIKLLNSNAFCEQSYISRSGLLANPKTEISLY